MPSPLMIDPEAVLWSVSDDERAAALATRPLLVLLHGRGSHEHDLFALVSLLPSQFVVAALRAPLTLGPGSYSWFPAAEPGRPSLAAADDATDAVFDWLDSVEPAASVSILGFSQGGAMALQAMRRGPERFDSYVCLAGFVVPGIAPGDDALQTLRPPVFWGRDIADPTIPADAVERTTEWLPTHSTLTTRLYDGVGHSISREEIADAADFLSRAR